MTFNRQRYKRAGIAIVDLVQAMTLDVASPHVSACNGARSRYIFQPAMMSRYMFQPAIMKAKADKAGVAKEVTEEAVK